MAYNILIVDDSSTTRAVIKRSLEMSHVPLENCYEAPNGKAALELLAWHEVDLVLADLHMPEMGGVELIRHIMADQATRNIPVVVITAEPNSARLAELKAAGVRQCVRKPFTPERLGTTVCEILGVSHV